MSADHFFFSCEQAILDYNKILILTPNYLLPHEPYMKVKLVFTLPTQVVSVGRPVTPAIRGFVRKQNIKLQADQWPRDLKVSRNPCRLISNYIDSILLLYTLCIPTKVTGEMYLLPKRLHFSILNQLEQEIVTY